MSSRALSRSLLATVVAVIATAGAPARAAAQTVDAGMTREQVVGRLGRPVGERTAGPRTYLFYRNGCERACGMHDLVVLENDAVVDAIFRQRGRRYSGESSSPVAVPPRNDARNDARGDARAGARGAQGGSAGGAGGAARRARPADAEARPTSEQVRNSLPAGARRGGIVVGGGAPDTATPPATPRRVRAAAGAAGGGQAAGDSGSARPRRQSGGQVRVPIVPRDTQLGVQPRERGQRTLPGPVTVPTLPRDTQVARPDSAARRQAPPPRPDSSTSTRNPR